jgi:hypothetical protein
MRVVKMFVRVASSCLPQERRTGRDSRFGAGSSRPAGRSCECDMQVETE